MKELRLSNSRRGKGVGDKRTNREEGGRKAGNKQRMRGNEKT